MALDFSVGTCVVVAWIVLRSVFLLVIVCVCVCVCVLTSYVHPRCVVYWYQFHFCPRVAGGCKVGKAQAGGDMLFL